MIAQPFVPPDHWTLDPVDGGGRLITEGEHFIDLCNLLIGKRPVSVTARALGKVPDDIRTLCNFAVTLHYDGAAATIVFDECGAPGFPRERLSVFAHGQVAILDDFAKLTEFGQGKPRARAPACTSPWATPRSSSSSSAPCRASPTTCCPGRTPRWRRLCMFAAQESIRLGAEIDLDQFRRSLLAPAEEAEAGDGAEAGGGDGDSPAGTRRARRRSHGGPAVTPPRAASRLRRVPFSARIAPERLSGKSIFEASHYRESNLTRLVNLFAHADVERWRGMRVLEVGAGLGHLGDAFADLGFDVTSTDGRQEHVEAMQARGRESSVLDLDLTGVNEAGDFELILAFGVLYHLAHPEEFLHSLR